MWNTRLQELLAFRTEHGHLNVPRGWLENPPLAHWVINQRRLIRLGLLSRERRAILEELEIDWPSAQERLRTRERDWDRMLDALAAHRQHEGHFDVPSDDGPTAGLARWVACQRHLYRRGMLREDRRRRLFALGIDWTPDRGRSPARDRAWDQMFGALAAFARAHGHCRVPKGWPANPKLARWVIRQRHHLRSRSMSPDRHQRLDELGVGRPRPPVIAPAPVHGRRELAWRAMFASLRAFRNAHGHCTVPRRWSWNPRLARWLHHQRGLYRNGRLPSEHEQLLNVLGADWTGARAVVPAPRTAVRVR